MKNKTNRKLTTPWDGSTIDCEGMTEYILVLLRTAYKSLDNVSLDPQKCVQQDWHPNKDTSWTKNLF